MPKGPPSPSPSPNPPGFLFFFLFFQLIQSTASLHGYCIRLLGRKGGMEMNRQNLLFAAGAALAAALNLAPYELIPLVLGSCATASQARALLEKVRLIAQPFAPGYPLAPLHWQVAGPDGSFILEPMEDGLHFYEDKAGVLTNNPPYPYQVMNLNNYRALSPATPPEHL